MAGGEEERRKANSMWGECKEAEMAEARTRDALDSSSARRFRRSEREREPTAKCKICLCGECGGGRKDGRREGRKEGSNSSLQLNMVVLVRDGDILSGMANVATR